MLVGANRQGSIQHLCLKTLSTSTIFLVFNFQEDLRVEITQNAEDLEQLVVSSMMLGKTVFVTGLSKKIDSKMGRLLHLITTGMHNSYPIGHYYFVFC
jgi:hypothetical protein